VTLEHARDDIVFDARLGGRQFTFHSTWGLFSPKAIDEGTQLLADRLDVGPDDDCLDLGCGYGALGLVMAHHAPRGTTHLIDSDFVAVEYARKNAELNGIANVQVYLSNGFDHVPADARFDVIASNIPAKVGGRLLGRFLDDAHKRLRPGGRLYVVSISRLKDYVKRNLTERFENYEKLKQSKLYTAAVARKD
jgi:16S rRNA (guanine1207-N2)-methyltransferase